MAQRLSSPRFAVAPLTVIVSLVLSGTSAAEDDPAVPGQLIVRFKDGVSKGTIDGINQFMGVNANRVTPADSQLYVIDLPQGMDEVSGLNIFGNMGATLYVERNLLYESSAIPNDPLWPQLWGLRQISAPDAWDISVGDPSIVIADTDTGANYNHPDLGPNVWVNQGEICNNGIDDDNNGYIDDCIGWDFFNNNNNPIDTAGHGSNTAGIMGAVGNNGIGVTGVMWNAQIMLLKMGNGSFPVTAIVPAIDYASSNGARIINASWGGPFSAAIRDAIVRAQSAGVLFVTAAGNNGRNIDTNPVYPASLGPELDNIISVANTTQSDDLYMGTSPNVPSNWGPNTVHLAAPGTNILSTYRTSGYVAYWGTSQAAPHVAATAGLILSVNPFLSYLDVKNIILSSVDPIPALSDKVITGGRLNAGAALQITPSP